MPIFKPVKYYYKKYPEGIDPKLEEVAAHFEKDKINPNMKYSLHTEYSYLRRKFSSELLDGLNVINNAHKGHIPLLWYNKKWSEEFSVFIEKLTENHQPPENIEIHPPFI